MGASHGKHPSGSAADALSVNKQTKLTKDQLEFWIRENVQGSALELENKNITSDTLRQVVGNGPGSFRNLGRKFTMNISSLCAL